MQTCSPFDTVSEKYNAISEERGVWMHFYRHMKVLLLPVAWKRQLDVAWLWSSDDVDHANSRMRSCSWAKATRLCQRQLISPTALDDLQRSCMNMPVAWCFVYFARWSESNITCFDAVLRTSIPGSWRKQIPVIPGRSLQIRRFSRIAQVWDWVVIAIARKRSPYFAPFVEPSDLLASRKDYQW